MCVCVFVCVDESQKRRAVVSEGNGGSGRGRHCAERDQILVHTQYRGLV